MERPSSAFGGRQVSYYLDGTDTSEQHQGGSWIQTSVDALQEFHSRSGSFFNATTKSGSNGIRGSLYEFLRNEKLDACNFFGSRRDLLKRTSSEPRWGGPVFIPRVYNGKITFTPERNSARDLLTAFKHPVKSHISGLDGENIHYARDAIDGFCNPFGLLTVLYRWYRTREGDRSALRVHVHASEGNQAHVGREFGLNRCGD
jgi:hypothetical protein